MHTRSALLYSFVVYILSFILGIFGLVIFGYGPELNAVPSEIYLYGIATSIILMMIFTRVYFQKSGIKPNSVSGAYFGLAAVAIGFLIDFCIAILPALFSENGPDLLAYYSHPLFWANLAIIPVTSAITGSYLQKSSMTLPKKTASKKSSKKTKKS